MTSDSICEDGESRLNRRKKGVRRRFADDREDLLREATALVQRVELHTELASGASIVAGFRRNGAASFFFGAEPVYQFNTQRELRRGYHGGRLLVADKRSLFSLQRRPAPDAVHLVRQQLSEDETREFLTDAANLLLALRSMLEQREYQVIGQVPAEVDLPPRMLEWLHELPTPIQIAGRPNVS